MILSTIKKKIIKHTELRVSTYELYMFAIKKSLLNPSTLFNQLTQMESTSLSQERLCEFILNIVPGDCDDGSEKQSCSVLDTDKNVFTYEDFINISDFNWDSVTNLTIPIGQKLTQKKLYHFISNPYNV